MSNPQGRDRALDRFEDDGHAVCGHRRPEHGAEDIKDLDLGQRPPGPQEREPVDDGRHPRTDDDDDPRPDQMCGLLSAFEQPDTKRDDQRAGDDAVEREALHLVAWADSRQRDGRYFGAGGFEPIGGGAS
jgi:hypothetical protein